MALDKKLQRNALKEGSFLGLGALLALVLFAMVNYLGLRHYDRFDWTSSRLYTLSEKSRQVLTQVDRDIDIVIWMNPDSELFGPVDELLSRYEAERPQHIRKRVVDSAKNLLEAQSLMEQFEIDRDNVIVLATESDRQVIDQFELADYDYSGTQYGQGPTMTGFKGEQEITSAILELVASRRPRALFTEGHGEGRFDAPGPRSFATAREILRKDNFSIEPWRSLGAEEVPEGTDLLLIAGPTSNFLPPELAAFDRYLERGGRMLLLLDPIFREDGDFVDLGLEDWLRGLGIEAGQDVVIDPARQMPFFGPETLYTDTFGPHPIVQPLAQTRTPLLIPLSRSITRTGEDNAGGSLTELVLSSPEAWAETQLADLENLAQDEDEREGPISLGVALSFVSDGQGSGGSGSEEAAGEGSTATEGSGNSESEPPEARLVVFGDSDFATDAQVANAGNTSLLLNALNWLVERESMITIEPKRPEQTRLALARSELLQIHLIVLLLMPGLAVVAGTVVYLRRRR